MPDAEADESVRGGVGEVVGGLGREADAGKLEQARELVGRGGSADLDGLERGGLPHPSPESGVGALLDEEASGGIAQHDAVGEELFLASGGLGAGDFALEAAGEGEAVRADGARGAARGFRDADRRAEFDQGFVERAGVGGAFGGGEEGGGSGRGELDGLGAGEGEVLALEAEDDARNVAIDGGNGAVEGEGGDGAGGVAADAWKVEEVVGVGGDGGRVTVGDGSGGGVEVAGSAVVTETGPFGEDVVLVGSGEGGEGGEAVHEEREPLGDAGGLGLLEHELGDEGLVGVARAGSSGRAPGEITSGGVEPKEQARDDPWIARAAVSAR